MPGPVRRVAARPGLGAAISLAAWLAASSAALAQDITAPAQPAVSEACELHIWPSEGMVGMKLGMWDNFQPGSGASTVGGQTMVFTAPSATRLLEGSDRASGFAKTADDGPLSGPNQLKRLQDLPLTQLLGLPESMLVVHETPLDNRALGQSARYGDSSANCYAELVISELLHSTEWANGRKLRSYIRFRQFGPDTTVKRQLATWVSIDLKINLEKHPGKAAEAAVEVASAFDSSIRKFSDYLAKAKAK